MTKYKKPVYFMCGGGVEIGCSSYVLCFGGEYSVCVDWGGGYNSSLEEPDIPSDQIIDALHISHAHHDHCGQVVSFAIRYPNARIFSTEPTKELCEIIWSQNKSFKDEDVRMTLDRIEIVNFNDIIYLTDDLCMMVFDSGHILGSASTYFIYEGEIFVLTNDVCMRDRGLLKAAKFPKLDGVRLLVRECTNIGRIIERKDFFQSEMTNVTRKVFDRGGKVVVPAFSIDRAQAVYRSLKDIPGNFSVFMDGAKATTSVYQRYFPDSGLSEIDRFSKNLINFNGSLNRAAEKERTDFLRSSGPGIVIATSGMVSGGTISSWWSRQVAPLSKNAIILVSYQDPDGKGYELSEANTGDIIDLDGIHTTVNCDVVRINLSGHMTRFDGENVEGLLNPATVIYTHGQITEMELYVHLKNKTRKGRRRRRIVPRVRRWVEV